MLIPQTALLSVLILAINGLNAIAETRVALVVGNGAYQSAPQLPNPKNDAQDVAASLKRLGFETIVGLDLDKTGMEDATIRFSRAARKADVAIFYYSGHAMQFAGVNYLMPVDAKLTDEADLRRMARVDDIVSDVQQARNLRILVLDSCRDNPLAEQFKRSIGNTRGITIQRGLAKIDSPQGMIVAYSTQAGRTAEDGTGRNSPYTKSFLKFIETPEEIGTVFRRVTADVYEGTKREQLPELSLSLIGEFYLRRQQPQEPTAPPVSAGLSSDEITWGFMRDTKDAEQIRRFIKQFPKSVHRNDAEARLVEIENIKKEQSKTAVVAPPVAQTAALRPVPKEVDAPLAKSTAAAADAPQPVVGIFSEAIGARPLTPERERTLKPKDTFKECEECPEMLVVPAGSFTFGSPATEIGRSADEGPQQRITFRQQFSVGKFSITFDQWDACVADNACSGYKPPDENWGRGRRPVIYVSWNDAKAYADWLSKKIGKPYRLLSEAQREYVSRAGTTTPFWTGPTISTDSANYNGNSIYGRGTKGEYRQQTISVDAFPSNPWGIHQVHGNVWEWVEDCWNANLMGAPSDGSARTTGDCSRRIYRGGAWYNPPSNLRSARRPGREAHERFNGLGFRVARTLIP